MTKSTITRERIQRIIRAIDSESYDEEEIREWLTSDEIMGLARMALAAMDSESGCLPLDYLQGHKDGLEWAAQLAEANHPETGDWLYDDPIELAKVIRKGPDMPPAQPAADSEPVAWTWHYREQWHVTSDKRRAEFVAKDGDVAVLPLYRHAQPAPVVPEEWAIADAVNFCKETGRQDAGAAMDAWNACRAAMLHAGNSPAKNGVAPAQSGNSPAIPDGYVLVSKEARKEILDEFDSIIDYGAEDSVDAWHRLLAAATQEVKP